MAAGVRKAFIWIAVIVAGIGLIYLWGEHHQHKATPVTSLSPHSGSAMLTADQAWNHIGDSATVQYQVGYATTDSQGDEFLNQDRSYLSGFTAVIYRDSLGTFSSDPIETYAGATIEVSGLIQSYEGHPEIVVSGPSQIILTGTGSSPTTTTGSSQIGSQAYCKGGSVPPNPPAVPAGWPASLTLPAGYVLAKVDTYADKSHQLWYTCPSGESVADMANAIQSTLKSQGWTVTCPPPIAGITDEIFLWFKDSKRSGGTVTINDQDPVTVDFPTGN